MSRAQAAVQTWGHRRVDQIGDASPTNLPIRFGIRLALRGSCWAVAAHSWFQNACGRTKLS